MFVEVLKSIFNGIVEGITEWLPISSTGHLILFDAFFPMNQSEAFKEMFDVVIQLGAILAVVVLYFKRLNPLSGDKSSWQKKETWAMWGKIVLAVIPAGILGTLFDDFLDEHFYNYIVVSIALIVYGVAFILIERRRKNKFYKIKTAEEIDCKTALGIGLFQVLSLIPGTSRSGSTILGAMLLGVSRTAGAEFSFFLAIPVMFGASGIKLLKFFLETGFGFTLEETVVLLMGTFVSFIVSLAAIKFLVGFVRRHSFESFGWYRIVLGAVVLLYFLFV